MAARRSAVLGTVLTLLAAPALAACSGGSEDEVRAAAQAFLDDWAAGDPAAAKPQRAYTRRAGAL